MKTNLDFVVIAVAVVLTVAAIVVYVMVDTYIDEATTCYYYRGCVDGANFAVTMLREYSKAGRSANDFNHDLNLWHDSLAREVERMGEVVR